MQDCIACEKVGADVNEDGYCPSCWDKFVKWRDSQPPMIEELFEEDAEDDDLDPCLDGELALPPDFEYDFPERRVNGANLEEAPEDFKY